MQHLKTQLQNGASAFGRVRSFTRNACIGAAVSVATVPAFAAIDVSAIQGELTDAGDSAGSVGTWIAVALVVLAGAGIVFSMLRKA